MGPTVFVSFIAAVVFSCWLYWWWLFLALHCSPPLPPATQLQQHNRDNDINNKDKNKRNRINIYNSNNNTKLIVPDCTLIYLTAPHVRLCTYASCSSLYLVYPTLSHVHHCTFSTWLYLTLCTSCISLCITVPHLPDCTSLYIVYPTVP